MPDSTTYKDAYTFYKIKEKARKVDHGWARIDTDEILTGKMSHWLGRNERRGQVLTIVFRCTPYICQRRLTPRGWTDIAIVR